MGIHRDRDTDGLDAGALIVPLVCTVLPRTRLTIHRIVEQVMSDSFLTGAGQLPKLRPIFEKMFWHANHLRPFRWSVMAAEQARA